MLDVWLHLHVYHSFAVDSWVPDCNVIMLTYYQSWQFKMANSKHGFESSNFVILPQLKKWDIVLVRNVARRPVLNIGGIGFCARSPPFSCLKYEPWVHQGSHSSAPTLVLLLPAFWHPNKRRSSAQETPQNHFFLFWFGLKLKRDKTCRS